MNSHADTIRAAIENDYTTVGARLGHDALDALLAEVQQLREALREIADTKTPPFVDVTAIQACGFMRETAKAALGPVVEE